MTEKKDLTLELINEIDRAYEENREEVIVKLKTTKGEQETIVYIDKFFSPTKIEVCIKELLQKADYLKNIIGGKDDMKEVMQLWLILLIIRNFSSLDIPYEFKKQLVILEKLTDTKILFQIYQAFDTKEITKVMAELNKVTLILQKRLDENEEKFQEVEKNLNSLDDLDKLKLKDDGDFKNE